MASSTPPNNRPNEKRGPPLHQIYALPAPIKTFPLPTFIPNNPISLFHIAYTWIGQFLSPPAAQPAVIHRATWSEATTSVHVTDEKSMRALWEQGFYGKGNLSRSEPNWLKREQVRRGLEEGHVSEIHTVERREERIRAKWERARLEQEVIRQTREKEARDAKRLEVIHEAVKPIPTPVVWSEASAPVGPLEILALPNSTVHLLALVKANGLVKGFSTEPSAPVGPNQILALPNSAADLVGFEAEDADNGCLTNGVLPTAFEANPEYKSALKLDVNDAGTITSASPLVDGNGETSLDTSSDSPAPDTPSTTRVIPGLHALKRQKNVRFSTKVEEATLLFSDPPSPSQSANGKSSPPKVDETAQVKSTALVNKEHLQLMPEEALWLKFGLGALAVTDPESGEDLSSKKLLTLFRQHCYFPPRTGPDDPDLQPDDNFLVHYAVYHHFRSLGWVPRAGIKFGVDWLLYTRGPVFDHAEFGLIVVPSYSDPWWKQSGKMPPRKTWHWLHSIVRVLSHVMKSLVLVYVEVPPPPSFDKCLEQGFAEALKLYTLREVMVKRWSSNRNR